MAFRQSTHYAPQRTYTTQEEPRFDGPPTQPDQQLEDSQEWILFSPVPASATDRTHTTTTTASTRQTAGRSRLSDYGSIDTAGRSYEYDEDVSEHSEAVADDEEDGELDSLDSHLLEFRAESAYGDANPVLPTHDGLGSFRLDGTMGEDVQEQLYAFERFNPRRIRRRRESLELGQRELENETSADNEQVRRIEEWRLEQSRALLDEIQKETRRRRQSVSSARVKSERDYHDEEVATLGDVSEVEARKPEQSIGEEEGESFWTRITRRVIHDLMGIDDRLLSILFGEGLPEEVEREAGRRGDWYAGIDKDQNDDSWEYRLLGRIARELGLLVNQLSDHPGAFSAYLQVQQQPLPYAGLPIIPETAANTEDGPQTQAGSASVPLFQPTIPSTVNAMDFAAPPTRSVEDEQGSAGPSKLRSQGYQESDDAHIGFSRDEWEKQLDIGLVFSYLRSRFTNRNAPSASSTLTGSRTTTSPQDAAARAARVHQLHPLVARPKTSERRASYKVIVPSGPIQQRRKSTSCASQSTKKSARRISGSSRHYWDINGSIGSGSIAASLGGWGEV